MWNEQQAEKRRLEQEVLEARTQYATAIERLVNGTDASGVDLHTLAAKTAYTPHELDQIRMQAFERYALNVLADDIVTEEEDKGMQAVVPALGLTWEAINGALPELLDHIAIAEANAGMLGTLPSSRAILKQGEVAHWQCGAALMKEVDVREFRGGYQGMSFPVGKKGVRYRFGGVRGLSVVTGRELKVADEGVLVITSKRSVFMGRTKTQEFAHAKLVGLDVFTDGVRFHVSNRQTTSLFRVDNGEVIAATVHAAATRLVSGAG